MFYFIFIFIIIALSLKLPYKEQLRLSNIASCLMLLLCGLRGKTVCIDTHRYLSFASYDAEGTRYGVVFEYLNHLNHLIGGSPHLFLFIVAVLTYIPLIIVMNDRKYVEKPALFLLLFYFASPLFFQETFNLARQMMACSFVFLAIYLLEKRKIVPTAIAVLLSIIAILTHKMILFVAPVALISYILLRRQLSLKIISISLVVSIILGALPGWDSYLTQFMFMMETSDINNNEGGIDFTGYLNDESYISSLNLFGIIQTTFPMAILCLFSYVKKDKEKAAFFNMFFVGTLCYCLFAQSNYCRRLTIPVTMFILLYLPYVWDHIEIKYRTILKCILAYMVIYYFSVLIRYDSDPSLNGVLPYVFCFLE